MLLGSGFLLMSMTDAEIDLLRETLGQLQRNKRLATEVFYENLFEIDPSLRALFDDDLPATADKVLFAFGAVVAQIHDLDLCRELSRDLANRHVSYGVKAEHYATVGKAVLVTVGMAMGERMSPEIEAVWRKAYAAVADVMIETAYGKWEGKAPPASPTALLH